MRVRGGGGLFYPLFVVLIMGGYPLAFLLLGIAAACFYVRAVSDYPTNASLIGGVVCFVCGMGGLAAQQLLAGA